MDKDTLILIAGQLTKDKLSMIEMHEQLIERLGNTQEAEDYVYNEHLGKYIPILESLITKLCSCVASPTSKISQILLLIVFPKQFTTPRTLSGCKKLPVENCLKNCLPGAYFTLTAPIISWPRMQSQPSFVSSKMRTKTSKFAWPWRAQKVPTMPCFCRNLLGSSTC